MWPWVVASRLVTRSTSVLASGMVWPGSCPTWTRTMVTTVVFAGFFLLVGSTGAFLGALAVMVTGSKVMVLRLAVASAACTYFGATMLKMMVASTNVMAAIIQRVA